MAQIPLAALDYLTDEVNTISADAKAKVLRVLEKLDWNDVPACRDAVVQVMQMVTKEYGAASAQAAADFYDVAREASLGEAMGATAHAGLNPKATEGAVRAFVKDAVDGNYGSFNRKCLDRIDYELKCAAANSAKYNGGRDRRKPRFARVPSGSETCRFCIMLASRGPVYTSRDSAGANGHFHSNCDCRIVPFWDAVNVGPSRYASTGTTVEGYDPDELYDRYLDFYKDPAFRERCAKAAAKGANSKGGRPTTHAALWAKNVREGKVKLKSYGEIGDYLYAAKDYEDLFERMEFVKSEFPYYGIDPGSEGVRQIKEYGRGTRRKVLGRQMEVIRGHIASPDGQGRSVGAARATDRRSANVKLTKAQFGKKARKHAAEWGLDPSSPTDRDAFEQVISGIIDEAEDVDIGDWRGQPGPCTFFRKGNDLVIVNADDEFVTIMKGGGSNKRYHNAIGR